jgi:heptaprenyl diphosphate synthase
LSTIEYLIPKPLPFMRIGLANLPLMLALGLFPLPGYALLVLVKVFGQAMVTGTLFSYVFLFSFAGSFVSALSMFALRRLLGPARLSFAGIGIAGAMLSNGTQLFLARFLVFGPGVQFLFPPFLAAGLVTGLVLGLFCERFRARSRWYAAACGVNIAEKPSPGGDAENSVLPEPKRSPAEKRRRLRRARWEEWFSGRELLVAALLMGLAFLFNPSTPGRIVQFLFFWFCAWASGKRNNPLITLTVLLGILLVNLLSPYGKVLAEFGFIRITAGSLESGIRNGITLEGLLFLSGAVIRGRNSLPLPGAFGALLGESFRLFGILSGRRFSISKPTRVIDEIDRLLLELGDLRPSPEDSAGPGGKARSPLTGRIIPALAVLFVGLWTLLPVLKSFLYK